MRAPVPVLALSLLAACGDPEPVPFGLERPATPEPTTPAAPAELPRQEISAWPPGTTAADVAGVHLTVAAPEALRATLAVDMDGDADLDLLALVDTGTAVELRFGPRDGDTAPLRPLVTAPTPEGCTTEGAELELLDARLALASTEWSCPNANAGSHAEHHAVVELGALPRVLERFGLRGAAGDRLSFVAADRDEDGHPDVVLEVEVAGAHASLAFRSTAAGLSREGDALESAIAGAADEARAAIRRSPEVALTGAENALALWTALCRESEAPRLTLGDDEGISCGTSVGAARARAVRVAAHARLGHVIDALRLERELGAIDAHLRDAERRLVREALDAMEAEAPALHTSVEAAPLEGAMRRSSLAFADEGHVLILSGEPRNVGLEDGMLMPSSPIDAQIVDPSGRLALQGIERRCEGTVLAVGPRGAPAFEPTTALVEPRPAPFGVPCPEMTSALRADPGGFFALGWAPQGVLVARLDELWVVPLDLSGALAGASSPLPSDAPAPAPVLPGAATSDVSAYALLTDHGVLVVQRGPEASTALVRPEGYAHDGAAIDVAVSPSGRRLAWIAGGHLVWVER